MIITINNHGAANQAALMDGGFYVLWAAERTSPFRFHVDVSNVRYPEGILTKIADSI